MKTARNVPNLIVGNLRVFYSGIVKIKRVVVVGNSFVTQSLIQPKPHKTTLFWLNKKIKPAKTIQKHLILAE